MKTHRQILYEEGVKEFPKEFKEEGDGFDLPENEDLRRVLDATMDRVARQAFEAGKSGTYSTYEDYNAGVQWT